MSRFYWQISELSHVKVLLASRLVKFQQMMIESNRPEITMLATMNSNDSRTRHGYNLKKIANECSIKIEDLSSYIVKDNMKFFHVPEQDKWKIPIVEELLNSSALNESERNDRNELIKMMTTS